VTRPGHTTEAHRAAAAIAELGDELDDEVQESAPPWQGE
jgi:hypothetical protein